MKPCRVPANCLGSPAWPRLPLIAGLALWCGAAGSLIGCGSEAAVGGRGERHELAVGPAFSAIRLDGTPYELGWHQGRLLPSEIRERLSAALEPTLEQALTAYASQMRPLLPVGVEEELRGIAAGAGVSAEALFLREVAREGIRWHDDAAPTLRASLVVSPGSPAQVLAAYQGFERVPGGGRFVVVERHPRDGVATIGIAWAGSIGLLAGLSSTGLLAAEGEVSGVFPERRSLRGVPFAIGLRVALERASDARDLVARLPRLVGNRVAVADGQGVRWVGLLHFGAGAPTPSTGWAFAPQGAFESGDAAWKRQEAEASPPGPDVASGRALEVLRAGEEAGAPALTITLSAVEGLSIGQGATTQRFPLAR